MKNTCIGNTGPEITITIVPDERPRKFPRPKTARQLLSALGLDEERALVARKGKLLTPDCQIWPGDEIWVRPVGAKG